MLFADSLRLADRAARDDVAVTREITPYAQHVFQGFSSVVDEAVVALDSVARFVRRCLAVEVGAVR